MTLTDRRFGLKGSRRDRAVEPGPMVVSGKTIGCRPGVALLDAI